MTSVRTSIFAVAVLAAGGLIAAINLAYGLPQIAPTLSAPAATVVATRFPQINEMMIARMIMPAQSDAVFSSQAEPAAEPVFVPTENCVHEHWPYIADECLVARDGTSVRKPVRTISIENRA